MNWRLEFRNGRLRFFNKSKILREKLDAAEANLSPLTVNILVKDYIKPAVALIVIEETEKMRGRQTQLEKRIEALEGK